MALHCRVLDRARASLLVGQKQQQHAELAHESSQSDDEGSGQQQVVLTASVSVLPRSAAGVNRHGPRDPETDKVSAAPTCLALPWDAQMGWN